MNLVFKTIGWLVTIAGMGLLGIFFLKPGLDGIGAKLDVSGDGLLTPDELPPVIRRNLDAIDWNGDRRLGPVELRLYRLGEMVSGAGVHEPPAYEGDYRFSDLGGYLADCVTAGRMQGVVLMLGHQSETVYTIGLGGLMPDSQVPMASATKWMTAAVMGGLAKRGVVDLERPVGEWADAIPASHGAMTVSHMLAHVSGIESRVGVTGAPTLDEAAQQALALPVVADPGERFHYGASSTTLAAWIAEQQTGKPWRTLAEETIFDPLGMDDTVYANPVRPLEYGLEAAPQVASGVHSTAKDTMTFLGMIAAHGRRADGFRVLSARVVRQLEQARTIGAERGFVPPAVTHDFQYALGTWCEDWDESGRCGLMHAQGAFGTRPFLDRESGIYGIVLMVESGDEQSRIIQRIREVALKTAKNELGFIQ